MRPEGLAIGIGNRLRGDDAIGLAVAEGLTARRPDIEVVAHEGEPLDLLGIWAGVRDAVIVDAVAGPRPGRVHRLVGPALAGLERGISFASTHAFDLGQVIELAGATGRLPARVELIAIEGSSFELGAPPSNAVAEAGRSVVRALAREASYGGRRLARPSSSSASSSRY